MKRESGQETTVRELPYPCVNYTELQSLIPADGLTPW